METDTPNSLPPLRMPRQSDIVARLASVLAFCLREGIESTDVRLQVLHGDSSAGDAWEVHSGDASFDTDHRGYWGASSVARDVDLWAVAEELIEQAAEHAAQNGRTIEEDGATFAHKAGREWWAIRSDNGGASFDRIAVASTRNLLPAAASKRSPVQLREESDKRRRTKENKRRDRMRELRNELAKVATAEELEEIAHDVLRADYWGHVRSIADDVAERVRDAVKDGTDVDEAVSEALHEACDGSAMVIYTAQNFQVLRYCENHDAYTETMGDVPTDSGGGLNLAALAFSALESDVRDTFEREHGEELRELAAKGDDET